MPSWNRFDIAEAHLAFCDDYHTGMWSDLYKRSCRIRRYLHPGAFWRGFASLSENGKAIYRQLKSKHVRNKTRK